MAFETMPVEKFAVVLDHFARPDFFHSHDIVIEPRPAPLERDAQGGEFLP